MIKKSWLIIALLIILTINVVYAENEITFQGIPWLTNEITTVQFLSGKDLLSEVPNTAGLLRDKVAYIITDDNINYRPDIIMGYESVSFALDLSGKVKGKIAGYPVKNIILTFAYDGEYKLISCKIELYNGKYEDLKAKLTKVYGEAENNITEEGIESNIWKGDNNSAVLLYTQSQGTDFTLIYGRTDADEILMNSLNADFVDADDVSGL